MNSFVAKHRPEINGVLECFDRVILRGHLPIARGLFSTWLFSKQIALNMRQLSDGWWNFRNARLVCRDVESSRSDAGRAGEPSLPALTARADGGKRSRDGPARWHLRGPRVRYGTRKPPAPSACSTIRMAPKFARTGASGWSSISTGWIENSA